MFYNKIKKLLGLILMVVLIFFCYFMSDAQKSDKLIEDFISRGEFVKEIDGTEYYVVHKKYNYENIDYRIIDYTNDIFVGSIGDIYISSSDPFGTMTTSFLSKRIKMGHAAIINSDDAKTLFDIVGNSKNGNNIVKEQNNDWFIQDIKNDIVVLRIKNIDTTNRTRITEQLNSYRGYKYNYNIFFHSKNKFYCFDLISKIYEDINIDIDGDSVVTYGSKLINDLDTYIIYYKKKEKGIYKIYYLGD